MYPLQFGINFTFLISRKLLNYKYSSIFKLAFILWKLYLTFDCFRVLFAECYTPRKSGLRERKRADSPTMQGPKMTEVWVEEDQLELWEIKSFAERF